MPSSKNNHPVFFPLVAFSFFLWVLYRSIFAFPVWFDETIGKAIFFGLPVWLYITLTKSERIVATFAQNKINAGLLLGIAVGGIYGFVGSVIGLLTAGGQVQAAALFSSPNFWWEFFLAMMTGFWETLFFFSWIMVVMQEKMHKQSLLTQVVSVALIFMIFHIPNSILRFEGWAMIVQIVLMFMFALGQALMFARWKNFYTLVISHAIWGMVLLIHV